MAMLKSFPPGGRKQAPVPGPNSAAFKKIVAAKKSRATEGSKSRKSGSKKVARDDEFSSVESRRMLVERLKQKIWASMLNINDAIINLALAGNFNAAKALFDFAGVYSLPQPGDENAKAAPIVGPLSAGEELDPVEAFFRSIGVEPPDAQPEPGTVAAG